MKEPACLTPSPHHTALSVLERCHQLGFAPPDLHFALRVAQSLDRPCLVVTGGEKQTVIVSRGNA